MAIGQAGPRQGWAGPFAAILGCYLITYCTIQLSYPFVSLYLRDLGESETSAIAWTGAINTSLPLLIMVASAFWGNLADRVGLKLMVVRALVVSIVVFGATALVGAAWQVLALFLFYGLTGSAPPALSSLAAASLPRQRISMGMGMMQTVQFIGLSIGPLVGALIIGLAGYRGPFQLAAVLMALTLLIAAIFIREPLARGLSGARRLGLREGLAVVGRAPRLRAPLLAMLAFNGALSAGQTLLPLHVQQMAGGDIALSSSVGVVLASAGVGTALGSALLSWWSGRLGASRVALVSLILAGLCSVPCFWVTDVLAFCAIRFVVGFFSGGVLPALQSVLVEMTARHAAVASNVGTVQGLSQSAISGGSALGAASAAFVAARWSLPAMFLVSAAGMLLAALWWRQEVTDRPDRHAPDRP